MSKTSSKIDSALKLMRLFLREKDEKLASAWPKKEIARVYRGSVERGGPGRDVSYPFAVLDISIPTSAFPRVARLQYQ
jgi:hypothetical protein